MKARMHVSTRVINGDSVRALYQGDVLEGAEAEQQVALGNAEELKEEAPEPKKKS